MVLGPPSPLGCLLRILGIFGTLFLLAVIAGVVLVVLAFSGSPGNCGKGIPAGVDQAAASAFDSKLLTLNAALAFGRGGEFTVDEREATARARLFLEENDAPVTDLTLCFRPGKAISKGHVDTPLFGGVDVQVTGTVSASGLHPNVDVQEVRVGKLPAFFTAPFKGLINRIADDQAKQITLGNRYNVTFEQGTATLAGIPPQASP